MDRKSWVIVALCLALIGGNFYYSNKNQKALAAQQQQVENLVPTTPLNPSGAPAADLTVPDPEPDTEYTTWTLTATKEEDGKQVPAVTYTISNRGGSIRQAQMVGMPINSQTVPDHDLAINENAPYGIGTLLFGITPAADPIYDKTVYHKVDSLSNDRKLTLIGKTATGLAIKKEFVLDPMKGSDGKPLDGSTYMIRMNVTVENATGQPLRLVDMGVFSGASYPIAKSETGDYFTNFFYMADGKFVQESPSYFTGGYFSSAKARAVETLQNLTYAGVMSQYYSTILIPAEDSRGSLVYAQPEQIHLTHEGDQEVKGVALAMGAPVLNLNDKESRTLSYEIYAGPKENQVLGDLPYDLDEVMAYGWLTCLSSPMNWLLNFCHSIVGNWGLAIICMTLIIRGIIWPLYKKSYMSMKRMSQMQPKIQELREKYPDDQQTMNMEMMKLYQEYGINPASGCLPLLIQCPIFFAFYRVLQYSAELRDQPFFGWITDLSLPDTVYTIPLPFSAFPQLPINILPLIMAVTMIIQMRMTPQAGDKMQRRIMSLMPWMFFLFCYNFASALALYWTTQNLINMAQTLIIRRLPMPELKRTKKKKGGFFERLAEQQRILAEQQEQQKRQMRRVTPKNK
jgi:YidC/Oxa1 family membrane protein insertase